MQPTVRYIFGRLRLLSPGRDGDIGNGNGGAPKLSRWSLASNGVSPATRYIE